MKIKLFLSFLLFLLEAIFFSSYSQSCKTNDIILLRIKQQLLNDYDSIRIKYINDKNLFDDINQIDNLNFNNDFKAIIPFQLPSQSENISKIHQRIFNHQRKYWNNVLGLNSLIIWKSNEWDMLNHLQDPPINSTPLELNMSMMVNEYRSICFNISNPLETEKNKIEKGGIIFHNYN